MSGPIWETAVRRGAGLLEAAWLIKAPAWPATWRELRATAAKARHRIKRLQLRRPPPGRACPTCAARPGKPCTATAGGLLGRRRGRSHAARTAPC